MSSVLMPLRAFVDSDLRGANLTGANLTEVLMPLRAFVDSDKRQLANITKPQGRSLNALAGIC